MSVLMRNGLLIGVLAAAVMDGAAEADSSRHQVVPLLVQAKPDGNPERKKSGPELKTLDQFGHAIAACWKPPSPAVAPQDIMITVKLSFTRDGEVFGSPTLTYITPGTTPEHELAYRKAVADTFLRCTPLNLSKGLGNVIAGRPFSFTFGSEKGRNRAQRLDRSLS